MNEDHRFVEVFAAIRAARRARERLDEWLTTDSGLRIGARLRTPEILRGPAVLLVPPQGDGGSHWEEGLLPSALLEAGRPVFVYDPPGIGASWGEADAGGPHDREALRSALARLGADHPVQILARGSGGLTVIAALAELIERPLGWIWLHPTDGARPDGRCVRIEADGTTEGFSLTDRVRARLARSEAPEREAAAALEALSAQAQGAQARSSD